MTTREICKRLLEIHSRIYHDDPEEIGEKIDSLILDLVAPVEEPSDSDKNRPELGTDYETPSSKENLKISAKEWAKKEMEDNPL